MQTSITLHAISDLHLEHEANEKYVFFQLAEVAVPRQLFAAILERIGRLAMPPAECRSG